MSIKQLSPEELQQFLASSSPESKPVLSIVAPAHSDAALVTPCDSFSTPSLDNTQEVKTTTSQEVRETLSSPADINQQDDLTMPDGGWQCLKHETAMDMLAFYDEAVQKGSVTPYPWQYEVSDKLCEPGHSLSKPLKYALCASNGSGKDSFILAPFAVWFALTKIRSRVIITTGSGSQLTGQTEPNITHICNLINAYHGRKVFKVRQRYIQCLASGSEIRMFATDEAGKAEGYHPLEPNRDFAIIINEAKTVNEDIHQAIKRCTGYSHYFMVSSPGQPKGAFFHAFKYWPNNKQITTYDCPRSSNMDDLEEDKQLYGEHSAFFRSKHLALFTMLEAQVVINQDIINACLDRCKQWLYINWPKRVGIDLAAGGDECIVSIWQGNKRINQDAWTERDTTVSAYRIDKFLTANGITKDSLYIRADDGGVGHGIIDQLVRKGWITIKRVLNQSPARNKKAFGNKGAELWFQFKRLVEEGFILLPKEDTKFMDQLSSRHYKTPEVGSASERIMLMAKAEQKALGIKSPDRVDAAILAFADLTVNDFFDTKLDDSGNVTSIVGKQLQKSASNLLTNDEVKEAHERLRYERLDAQLQSSDYTNMHDVQPKYKENPSVSSFLATKQSGQKRLARGSIMSLLRHNS